MSADRKPLGERMIAGESIDLTDPAERAEFDRNIAEINERYGLGLNLEPPVAARDAARNFGWALLYALVAYIAPHWFLSLLLAAVGVISLGSPILWLFERIEGRPWR